METREALHVIVEDPAKGDLPIQWITLNMICTALALLTIQSVHCCRRR